MPPRAPRRRRETGRSHRARRESVTVSVGERRSDAARLARAFPAADDAPAPAPAPSETKRLVGAVRAAGRPPPEDAEGWKALAAAAAALLAHARAAAPPERAVCRVAKTDGAGTARRPSGIDARRSLRDDDASTPRNIHAAPRGGAATRRQTHQKLWSRPQVRLAAADAASGAARKPFLECRTAHYAKLRTLHARFGGGDDAGDVDERIFCVLARYEALRGAGFQCAVPGAAFDGLRRYLGCTVECFASPLNCRFERYFSAFPALERSFGSLGSFFDEDAVDALRSGSFECNPPFVPEVMTFAARRIQRLLADASRGPLSAPPGGTRRRSRATPRGVGRAREATPRGRRESRSPRNRRKVETASPRNIHVAPAAAARLASTEYRRRGRGGAATRLHGISTSWPRRRRDP